MPSYVDSAHQIGIGATIKLVAFTDGAVTPASFSGESPAFTIDIEGVEPSLSLEEFSQKDSFGRETKWNGSRSGQFGFSIHEKTTAATAVLCGLNPSVVSTTAMTGFTTAEIDGTQTTHYWSAYIYGTFPDTNVFGYILKKCHFQPQNLPSIKQASAPMAATLIADPLDSGGSIVVLETT